MENAHHWWDSIQPWLELNDQAHIDQKPWETLNYPSLYPPHNVTHLVQEEEGFDEIDVDDTNMHELGFSQPWLAPTCQSFLMLGHGCPNRSQTGNSVTLQWRRKILQSST